MFDCDERIGATGCIFPLQLYETCSGSSKIKMNCFFCFLFRLKCCFFFAALPSNRQKSRLFPRSAKLSFRLLFQSSRYLALTLVRWRKSNRLCCRCSIFITRRVLFLCYHLSVFSLFLWKLLGLIRQKVLLSQLFQEFPTRIGSLFKMDMPFLLFVIQFRLQSLTTRRNIMDWSNLILIDLNLRLLVDVVISRKWSATIVAHAIAVFVLDTVVKFVRARIVKLTNWSAIQLSFVDTVPNGDWNAAVAPSLDMRFVLLPGIMRTGNVYIFSAVHTDHLTFTHHTATQILTTT